MPKKEISQWYTADIVNQGTNEDVFGTSQKGLNVLIAF